jgi:hypothetical protein
MTTPDLTHAKQLCHHRDPELDQPYGEGQEVTVWQLADGRWFERVYRYHVDFDGSTRERFITRAEAAEQVALYAPDQLERLFPDSEPARLVKRLGVARRAEAAPRAHELVAHEPLVARHGSAALHGRPNGPYVRVTAELLGADEARAWLRGIGASRELFRAQFPESLETALLGALGLSAWSDVAGRLSDATRLFDQPERGALHRVANVYVHERRSPAPLDVEPVDDAGALYVLAVLDAPAEVRANLVPSRDAWREMQRRAGVSFLET